MATSQTSKIQLTIQTNYTNPQALSGADAASARIAKNYLNTLLNGAGAGKASKVYAASRNLASNTSEDLDLAGSLVDVFGNTLTLTKVKAIAIIAKSTNTTSLTITRPSSNGVPFMLAAGDGFVLTPGALFLLTDPSSAGIAVTASTGDLIHVANASGAAADYDVVIVSE
jgi:hypothetical protein